MIITLQGTCTDVKPLKGPWIRPWRVMEQMLSETAGELPAQA